MRGYFRGQSNRDARASVCEEIWESGWEDARFHRAIVVSQSHIDGVHLDVSHQFVAYQRQSGLGITRGGRIVAVH